MVSTEAKREPVYEDEASALYWNPSMSCVEMVAKREPSSGTFRATLERVLQLMKDKRAIKLLADTSEAGKISNEDLLWTETDWTLRILNQTQVKYIAIVMPRSLGLHMSIDKITEHVQPESSAQIRRLFSDVKSAREWLERC